MNIDDYINTVGKQHKNEKQSFEFKFISTLRTFIEGAINNCSPSNNNVVKNIDISSLRYIVFLIDSKIKQHDGIIFSSHNEARQYVIDCINDKYSDKAVIGMFSLNVNSKEMLITMVETIGFVGDKKNINQLELFRKIF